MTRHASTEGKAYDAADPYAKLALAAAFLEQFDAYVQARAQMRSAADGSEDEQLCISHCASVWNSVLAAREALR